jgi:outer membrane lipoprotein-sorting protein
VGTKVEGNLPNWMKRRLPGVILVLLLVAVAAGQSPTPSPDAAASAPDLKAVLAEMDKAGTAFKSAQADIELVQYTKVVNEQDVQTGTIFFRRKGNNLDVSVRVVKPHAKQVVVKDGKLIFYDPKINQTTERDITNNRADVESFMNLGFGGRSHELLKDYEVKMVGWETVDGVRVAKLELVAKSERLQQFFSKIILWIDPERDVAVKQQRLESSGDYQVTHYTNIKLNGKVSDDVFRIKKAGSE